MKKKSFIFVAFIFCALIFIMPANAMAKGFFEHQDTVVPEHQTVDDVVVVGGDATILGTVNDSVVVLNGNVILKSSAKVNGFVLVIGGNVQQELGAVVKDEIINLSLDHATQNSLLIGLGLFVGGWLVQLALSVLFVILPVLTVLFSKQRLHPFVDRARTSPGHLLYIGFFSSLILIALTVLLLVTIIGIPIALIIIVLVVIAFVIGMTALSILVGERVQGISGRSDWGIALTGSIVLVSIMNVPFIGAILILGVLLFSIGVMTLWILEKIRSRRSARS